MQNTLKFFFKISKDAEFAMNIEGEPAEAYLQVSYSCDAAVLDNGQVSTEKLHLALAELAKVPVKYIIPISAGAYFKEMDEDNSIDCDKSCCISCDRPCEHNQVYQVNNV